ncbi:TPA: hypothetical protein MCX86_000683 [Klebsiella pneumoniae]|nr:hypothetical protein [Klebsiella pneumoniae]
MTQSCQKIIKLFSWKCVFTVDISNLNVLFEFIIKSYLYYQIILINIHLTYHLTCHINLFLIL